MKPGRQKPRISVNCLAKYSTGTAAARERILREQKYPPTFKTIYYSEVEDAIADFLSGRSSEADLLELRDELKSRKASSLPDSQRSKSCVEAIERFLDHAPDLKFGSCHLSRGDPNPPKLMYVGVEISVRPEVLVACRGKGGERHHGCIKLYFGKNDPLGQKSGRLIAAVVHQYAETLRPKGTECDRKLCLVLDVFAGAMFEAPRAVKRSRAEIEAACREIFDRWSRIEVGRRAG